VPEIWTQVKEFAIGDAVLRTSGANGGLSPYAGTVLAVTKGSSIEVRWPFGVERERNGDRLVHASTHILRFLPPSLSCTTSHTKIATVSKAWRHKEFPLSAYLQLAKSWHRGASEVVAYDNLYRTLQPNVNDESLRDEVSKFYRFAQNVQDMRIQSHIDKTAAYWVAQNRQYRATSDELKCGKLACPKCATRMRRATYRMQKGSKQKLFACPQCLYLIDPTSVLGPSGEPHDWFGVSR
jgi:hypothetical protein